MRTGKRISHNAGYAFMGVLLVVVLMGIALVQAGNSWSNLRQREREEELLRVGDKMREAIANYYNQSPGDVKQFPQTLDELLHDDRFPTPRRYLRKIYDDPMTGRPHWGTLHAPSGGIMGIYSLSAARPFKTANFKPVYESFARKRHYIEWIFAYTPETDMLGLP
jgi:type II secretory pathway pseudopilin PulG